MKKITGKDETVISEGTAIPELLFSDDALVVDYLNALLASDPALNMDFREIQILHQAIKTGWNSTGTANAVAGSSLTTETEFIKFEAGLLRNENETLKFKTELATIDAQVLRGENTNLKGEIACLTTQLNEIKHTLRTTLAQNNDLRSSIETSHNQLNSSTVNTKSTTQCVQANSAPYLEKTTEKTIDSDLEHVDTLDIVDLVIDQKEKPVPDITVQQDSITSENSHIIIPDPVTVVQEYHMDDKTCSAIDQDRLIISSVHVVNDREIQKKDSGVAIFSRRNSVEKSSTLIAKPVSKVIKQHHAEKHHGNQQDSQVLQVPSLNTAWPGKNNNEADRRPDFVQQQSVAEEINKQDDAPDSKMGMHPRDDADEINLAPIPAPKVVVRRNIKNYEDLQKESDTTNLPVVGHTIVL
jgi:hypothetical protein